MTADSVSISPPATVRVRRPAMRMLVGRGGAAPSAGRISTPLARKVSGDSSIGSVTGAKPATTARESAWNRWTGPGAT